MTQFMNVTEHYDGSSGGDQPELAPDQEPGGQEGDRRGRVHRGQQPGRCPGSAGR